MPKHFMYSDHQPGLQTADARLELHWQRERGVQLGATHWLGPGHPDGAQEYLEPVQDTGSEPVAPAWDGWFIEMDRDKINHLIKQLRAARDQAYGKDE